MGEEQEIAFHSLKQKLTSEPILQYPDFSKEFILKTYAFNEGAGAILSQGPGPTHCVCKSLFLQIREKL
jgi:hypothetical protein